MPNPTITAVDLAVVHFAEEGWRAFPPPDPPVFDVLIGIYHHRIRLDRWPHLFECVGGTTWDLTDNGRKRGHGPGPP